MLPAPNLSAATPSQIEFFETRIRPVLAQECYECHSESGKRKGGLLLDSRPGWQEGGESGPVILPGDAGGSLLLQTLRHTHPDLQMPKNGAKLDDRILADFERWIADGAPDPRDTPPTPEQLRADTDWNAVLQRRKQWWCFQPLQTPPPAKPLAPEELAAEIDRQLDEKIRAAGLSPAPPADIATVQRRLSFILTGLPTDKPNTSNSTYAKALLTSQAYAEKWARHWLDWLRYAETHGSEGDTPIPYAWRYRDYVIRAFAEDVPYFQMVREAIAGDLLPNPRLKEGLNESALGIGQLRMVLHGFSPTDSLDELVTWTDNQIETLSKAFQGLTVSCARCHDHKFDAISQADFYALYGILTSTRPAIIDVNAPGTGEAERAELQRLKKQIQLAVASAWMRALPEKTEGSESPSTLPATTQRWDLRHENTWFTDGNGLRQGATSAGEFSIALEGDRVIANLHPGGLFTDLISTADRAVLMSPRFHCEGGTLWFRVAGGGGAVAKYVVQNYPRTGTIHKASELKTDKDAVLGWHKLDLEYWKGDDLHIELTTAADRPAQANLDARSWFGITEAFITQSSDSPGNPAIPSRPGQDAVRAWLADTLTDGQAEALNRALQSGQLPNQLAALPEAAALVKKYRALEAQLPRPTRAPGVLEGDARDAALFVRGNHKQPAEIVPRRFLDGINPVPFETQQSGRLELAAHLTDPQNPLTARVIVNRLWHHVFGRGLVATTDNFGRLGQVPTHPELLDFLAAQFIADGGSMKRFIHALVSTRAFARSASVSDADIPVRNSNFARDPDNLHLARWTVRRLEAEAIRDSILHLSGQLDATPFGKPVPGTAPRRSVYVQVIRNKLDPFLTAFDMPVPSAPRGNRDVTNVPAQSLALLNDPVIQTWAADWAARTETQPAPEQRIRLLFQQALAREPQSNELQASLRFVEACLAEAHARQNRIEDLRRQEEALLGSVRSDASIKPDLSQVPAPLAEWTFENDTADTQGRLPLTLTGKARLENGALVLDGNSMAQTGSLPKTLTAKTLEAWVQLDHLTQRGGGVITVQGKDGGVFDSIVFAEKQPGHWVAGSDHFSRSEPFNGPAENEAAARPVHLAVVYAADGTVRGYRDGAPYGQAYRKAPGAVFEAETSQILLGCRHGRPSGNRGLAARLHRARLYDRALTPEQIAQTARLESLPLTDHALLSALPPNQRAQVQALRAELQELESESPADTTPEATAWQSLALSLLNLKEFIYLR